MVLTIIAVIAAFVIGIIAGKFIRKDRPVGDLRVDRSDPYDNPNLFLELDTDVQTIMRKKLVTFRVKLEDFLPHK